MSKQTILADLDELVALAVRLKQAVVETDDSAPEDVSDLTAQLEALELSFNKDNQANQGKANLTARLAIEQGGRMKAHRQAGSVAQGFTFIEQKLAAYKMGLGACFGNLHREG